MKVEKTVILGKEIRVIPEQIWNQMSTLSLSDLNDVDPVCWIQIDDSGFFKQYVIFYCEHLQQFYRLLLSFNEIHCSYEMIQENKEQAIKFYIMRMKRNSELELEDEDLIRSWAENGMERDRMIYWYKEQIETNQLKQAYIVNI